MKALLNFSKLITRLLSTTSLLIKLSTTSLGYQATVDKSVSTAKIEPLRYHRDSVLGSGHEVTQRSTSVCVWCVYTQTDRQTDRQKERQTGGHTDRHIHTYAYTAGALTLDLRVLLARG